MLSNGRLRSFGQAVAQRRYEFYIPGTVYETSELLPSVVEESQERSAPLPFYVPGWREPKRVRGIEDEKLLRYKTGKTLREWGKEDIFKRLQIIPTPIPYKAETIPGEEEIRQLPCYFVDGVPNFGQVPFGLGNTFGQSPEGATRGWWGELISSISIGAEKYLELQKSKYEAELAAAQAQKAALAPTPTVPKIIQEIGASKIIGVMALGGIAFLVFKKTKKGGRKRR